MDRDIEGGVTDSAASLSLSLSFYFLSCVRVSLYFGDEFQLKKVFPEIEGLKE